MAASCSPGSSRCCRWSTPLPEVGRGAAGRGAGRPRWRRGVCSGIHAYSRIRPRRWRSSGRPARRALRLQRPRKDARKVQRAAIAERHAEPRASSPATRTWSPSCPSRTPSTWCRMASILERFPRIAGVAGSNGLVRLLAVGRLVEKKGFDVLVDAVALLGPRFRLRIVGEGPERAGLAGAIARTGLGARDARPARSPTRAPGRSTGRAHRGRPVHRRLRRRSRRLAERAARSDGLRPADGREQRRRGRRRRSTTASMGLRLLVRPVPVAGADCARHLPAVRATV